MAWWEGVELPPTEAPPPGAAREPEPPPPPIKLEPWENPAIRVRHAIWGEGFRGPGGAPFALELVKPFAINNSMSILDFGCGAGGPARAITKEFDVWITGIERDRDYVDLGKLLSTKAGLERKAEIIAYDPENFVSRSGGFDCILSIETLFRFESREVILARLENCLKTRGQLTVCDYVRADHAAPDDPLIAAALGANTPALWTRGEYEKRFNELKFDLRVSEDITDKYRLMALMAFDQVTKVPEGKAVIRTFQDAFLAEFEEWDRRMKAIEAGVLKVYRFYGIKMGTATLMSNWS
ncbi:MAG TPA: methyltransferase domain-containing protein [Dongiaceae bacterium]|nr:methyltransferase domain-containing protein [Dongiaceae bacterium]